MPVSFLSIQKGLLLALALRHIFGVCLLKSLTTSLIQHCGFAVHMERVWSQSYDEWVIIMSHHVSGWTHIERGIEGQRTGTEERE